ncbi:MAG TPA: OmpA family protein [Polyangiaceae bacterium]|nr:OmpA family protein [Polyangiaceae bacterium]
MKSVRAATRLRKIAGMGEHPGSVKLCLLWTASVAIVLFFAGAARAQPRAEGFALDRFEPADRGSSWFYVESLGERYAAGVVFDYANRPLVLYLPTGKQEVAIIKHQLFAHFGGTIAATKHLRLALNVPVLLFQDGESARVSTALFEAEQRAALGDIGVGGDVLLAGRYGDPFTLSAGLRVFAPSGSRESYASNGAARLVPRINVAGRASLFTAAAQLGFRLRTWSDDLGFHIGAQDDDFAGSPMGGDALFAAAAGLRLAQGRIILGPEFSFATVAGDPNAFLAARTTSAEVVFGGHFAVGRFRIGFGTGPGLTRGFGTPAMRALCSLEWVQPVEAPAPAPARARLTAVDRDRDRDGIVDVRDACPDDRGVRAKDPKTNGCPSPADRDADGVPDATDACGQEAGIASDDPKTNGCPKPADDDSDGIADQQDACPNEAGVRTADPQTNGCRAAPVGAPGDRDEDGIRDADDACPDAAGPKNPFNRPKNGCPPAHVEKRMIQLRERVEFLPGSAALAVSSGAVLRAVLKILNDDPSIHRIEVRAHTDSEGNPDRNKALSQRRADAVVKWLITHGVAPVRLSARGFGDEQPIDDNATAAGRRNNRRIEFAIVERGAGNTH